MLVCTQTEAVMDHKADWKVQCLSYLHYKSQLYKGALDNNTSKCWDLSSVSSVILLNLTFFSDPNQYQCIITFSVVWISLNYSLEHFILFFCIFSAAVPPCGGLKYCLMKPCLPKQARNCMFEESK